MPLNRICILTFFVTGLACIAWGLRTRTAPQNVTRSSQVAVELRRILDEPVNPQPRPNGKAADLSKSLYDVNEAYLSMDLRHTNQLTSGHNLLTLAQGLRSGDAAVRRHCQELAFYMLSDWTYTHKESDWHRIPELDQFFRIFKGSNFAQVELYRQRLPIQPEIKFLNQI